MKLTSIETITAIALAALATPSQAYLSPSVRWSSSSSSRPSIPIIRQRSTLLRDIDGSEDQAVILDVEQSPATTNTNAFESESTTTTPPTTDAITPAPKKSTIAPITIPSERIEQVTKPRPYPLFLAEKGASFLFDPFQSKPSSSSSTLSSLTHNQPPRRAKENLVVLGTGWGAAAFVKNIDTTKFDVTVVSPRNYFVFTPMLAGASVGTVDFKSITQPIREVRSV
jgi:hypothetical protein